MAFENEKACTYRATGKAGFQNRSVHLAGERTDNTQNTTGLQPVSFPVGRVIARLERRFALSPAHARVVAEMAYPGAVQ